ncbi:SDR family NAD(P)-dependent oxidoreductase [Streptomyces sp. NPDC059255]|uniref:SDR family NAD(P)-dependent oxidoreductase n=1 Tax=Streptomyces sp. NPDC059255 TaxID=3346793 RepID=UPI0036BB2782
MGQLDHKTALIAGATSGIGLAAARALAAEGAYVFLTGRREERLEEAVAEIGADRATGIAADVTVLSDLDRVMTIIKESGRGLDILYANAGVGSVGSLGEITWEEFMSTFNTNVGGMVFTVQKTLPLLTKGSSVILCGSSIDVKAAPGMGVYAATKAAVRSLGRTWAAELVNLGIRVNVLAPGATDTAALAELTGDPAALMESLTTATPMNRIATPEETANVVVFLASDNSSFMTGSEIYVDGGHSQL